MDWWHPERDSILSPEDEVRIEKGRWKAGALGEILASNLWVAAIYMLMGYTMIKGAAMVAKIMSFMRLGTPLLEEMATVGAILLALGAVMAMAQPFYTRRSLVAWIVTTAISGYFFVNFVLRAIPEFIKLSEGDFNTFLVAALLYTLFIGGPSTVSFLGSGLLPVFRWFGSEERKDSKTEVEY